MKTLAPFLMLAPALAAAQENPAYFPPPLDYYVGTYQMIGADADGKLVNTALRIEIAGADLGIALCGMADAGRLALPETFGGDHYIEGRIGPYVVVCDPLNTYENYPLLACYTDNGARLTLWPGPVFSNPLVCDQ